MQPSQQQMEFPVQRSKMVSFRLSAEEYHRFEELREARRIPSLSDLARTAMRRMIATEDGEDPVSYDVRNLQFKLQSLSEELERLTRLVEARDNHGLNS